MLIQLLSPVRYFQRVAPNSLQLKIAGQLRVVYVTLNDPVEGIFIGQSCKFSPTDTIIGSVFLLTSDLTQDVMRVIDDSIQNHSKCKVCHPELDEYLAVTCIK